MAIDSLVKNKTVKISLFFIASNDAKLILVGIDNGENPIN